MTTSKTTPLEPIGKSHTDPVFYEEKEWSSHEGPQPSGWYFWDETWATFYGPYPNEEKARELLKRYCKEVLHDG